MAIAGNANAPLERLLCGGAPTGYRFRMQCADAATAGDALREARAVLRLGAGEEVEILPGHYSPAGGQRDWGLAPWEYRAEGFRIFTRRKA